MNQYRVEYSSRYWIWEKNEGEIENMTEENQTIRDEMNERTRLSIGSDLALIPCYVQLATELAIRQMENMAMMGQEQLKFSDVDLLQLCPTRTQNELVLEKIREGIFDRLDQANFTVSMTENHVIDFDGHNPEIDGMKNTWKTISVSWAEKELTLEENLQFLNNLKNKRKSEGK